MAQTTASTFFDVLEHEAAIRAYEHGAAIAETIGADMDPATAQEIARQLRSEADALRPVLAARNAELEVYLARRR